MARGISADDRDDTINLVAFEWLRMAGQPGAMALPPRETAFYSLRQHCADNAAQTGGFKVLARQSKTSGLDRSHGRNAFRPVLGIALQSLESDSTIHDQSCLLASRHSSAASNRRYHCVRWVS